MPPSALSASPDVLSAQLRLRHSSLSLESLWGSPEACLPKEEARAWVLVLNTGGTIGMGGTECEGLAPQAKKLVKALKKMPMLHDEEYAKATKVYDSCEFADSTLVLPLSKRKKRIIYSILEYSPLLDSCNMTTDDWAKIPKDLETYYERYDGFVMLHGTDTMAYTAAALSFMCENVGKTIVLTGSQVPIYELRNDGRSNLLGALLIAGQFVIPEVGLYFHHKLYRGNRVTKVDTGTFDGFSSPNVPPLANAEVDIKIDWGIVWRANTTKKFEVHHTNMNRNVGLLRIFPGITATTVRAFLQPPMEGIVLETYGCGNAPHNCPDLLEELRQATERNVVILNCTQCLRGSVASTYATGQDLAHVGVISGGDMTPEASLAKLSYVLGKRQLTWKEKKQMLGDSLRGEMSSVLTGTDSSLRNMKFIKVMTKFISLNCKEELGAFLPSLACAAAKADDMDALKDIEEVGGNLSCEDYDGRTPLHVASSEGHVQLAKYLLKSGASVYAKDRYGATPLMNAIEFRRMEIIQLLRETGARLSSEEMENAGTKLCLLAANGDTDGLMAWHLAGIDLECTDYGGKTPFQVVHQNEHSEQISTGKVLTGFLSEKKIGGLFFSFFSTHVEKKQGKDGIG
ncbi:60 kDa lysophospholipase-like [Rhineura floridana]|uniref:60 kDa lysophospholipase-like n=1 Tax=Rhineura floridana TaxID=261503 RepID=UPI002AC80EF4|nr:60 kDa lysophospholipase-like [Rhineura floridana]